MQKSERYRLGLLCKRGIKVVPLASNQEYAGSSPVTCFAGVIQSVECFVANEDAAGSYPATCLAVVVQNIARSPNGMASVLHTEIIRVRFPGEQPWVENISSDVIGF